MQVAAQRRKARLDLADLDSEDESPELVAVARKRTRLDSAGLDSGAGIMAENETEDPDSKSETSSSSSTIAEDEAANVASNADTPSSEIAVEKSPANTM